MLAPSIHRVNCKYPVRCTVSCCFIAWLLISLELHTLHDNCRSLLRSICVYATCLKRGCTSVWRRMNEKLQDSMYIQIYKIFIEIIAKWNEIHMMWEAENIYLIASFVIAYTRRREKIEANTHTHFTADRMELCQNLDCDRHQPWKGDQE